MTALPPIGTRVRCKGGGAVGTVEAHRTTFSMGGTSLMPRLTAFVLSPQGGGAWFTADEIEEMTDDE